jgi:hypothetical protein
MMGGKVRNRVFAYNAYHRDAQEIMIPNNEPPAIVVPPSGSFTTPAPPRGAAPWPTLIHSWDPRLSFDAH